MRVPVFKNVTVWNEDDNTTSTVLESNGTAAHYAFFFIECVCNAWFTLEIVIRLVQGVTKETQIFLFCSDRSSKILFLLHPSNVDMTSKWF